MCCSELYEGRKKTNGNNIQPVQKSPKEANKTKTKTVKIQGILLNQVKQISDWILRHIQVKERQLFRP